MSIDELTIGDAKRLAALFGPGDCVRKNGHPFIGKFVIARTRSAGVHFGVLAESSGTEAILKDARRLWFWSGAFTLSEVSQRGISDGKVSCAVPEIYLSETIELIPCSAKAASNLTGQKVHQP